MYGDTRNKLSLRPMVLQHMIVFRQPETMSVIECGADLAAAH